ncbi:MAG: immunoglobulin domain-containing protein, partial [Akkermansiaceae bacterium]|nr:immunoglobulin domain-containing protein [Akkermansiaceae bacterium]
MQPAHHELDGLEARPSAAAMPLHTRWPRILLLGVAGLWLGLANSAAAGPDPCPSGIWRFDEGTGLTAGDTTGNGNQGVLAGAQWTTGFSGTALAFAGGGQWFDGNAVVVPHSASLTFSGPFALTAAIKARGTDNYLVILDKFQYAAQGSSGFSFYLNSGRLRLSIYSGANGNKDLFGTTDLRDDAWHQVKASWDGAILRVHADGRLEGETAWAYPPAPTSQNLGIGKRLSGWGGYMPFLGIIDEVVFAAATGTAPAVTTQPASQTQVAGGTARFEVVATGTEPLSYQWYWNDTTALDGATQSVLVLENVSEAQAGGYSVQVSNCAGSVTSQTAILTVTPAVQPPVIAAGPRHQSAEPGGSATFSVLAVGQEPLSYQWRHGGDDLAGETGSVLQIHHCTPDHAGDYSVVVSNAGGSVVSSPAAVLRVVVPPVFGAGWFAGGDFHLPLPSLAGLSYTIEASDSLLPGSWTTLDNLLGTGSVLDIVDPASPAGRRFYRACMQRDSDQDGLTDAEELHLHGTDPLAADTDGDHLGDYDEVIVYLTNPLLADSDGGGMADEDEVGHGFDPGQGADDTQDADGDGLSNADEVALHHTNPRLADTDGDGLPDGQEVNLGTPPCSADIDHDGLNDAAEIAAGTQPANPDTDDDGMTDGWEVAQGLNPLVIDALNDPDGDGLVNLIEQALGTRPTNNDTDGDGMGDGAETTVVFRTNAADPGGDGKLDYVAETWIELDAAGDGSLERYNFAEVVGTTSMAGTLLGTTSDGLALYELDGDVFIDIDDVDTADEENEMAQYVLDELVVPGSAPQLPEADQGQERWHDADGDGLIDALDTDADGDGLPDAWENANGTGPYDPGDATADPDLDGLSNQREHELGTNPQQPDSDADGIPDGIEVQAGTNPSLNDAAPDLDQDGLSNLTEFQNGLGIADPDSDDDGIADGAEPQWNVDTDGDGRINALDPDADNDGLDDGQEQSLGTDPLSADTDGDTLSDQAEVLARTDPTKTDTDDDGLADNVDPSPLLPDGDDDGLLDGQEATADWFGAEDLAGSEGVLVADADAKGGQALVHRAGSATLFDVSHGLEAGSYRLFVRAKTSQLFAPLLQNGDFEQPGSGPAPDHWTFVTAGMPPWMTAVYPATPAFKNAAAAGINATGVMPGAIGEWMQTLNGPFQAGDEYTLSVSCQFSPVAQGFNAQAVLLWKNGPNIVKADWSREWTAGNWLPAAVSTSVPAGGVTALEIHLKAAATGPAPAQGSVMFDEVILTRLGDRVELSVKDDQGSELIDWQGVTDQHAVAPIYRWVSSPTFTLAISGTVQLKASDPQWGLGEIVAVDRAMVVPITNSTPKLTDPLDPDTDGDGIPDGAECGIKDNGIIAGSKSEITAHWFQAEDFCPRSQIRDHPAAANGKEVEPQPGPDLLCHISDPSFAANGSYTVYVRARTLNASDVNTLRVRISFGGGPVSTYNVTPARVVGFDPSRGVNVVVNFYEWFAAVAAAGGLPPGAVVSTPPSIAAVNQTGLLLQVHALGANKDRVRLDAVLLVKGPYTPTQLGEYRNADGINCYGLNLLVPRLTHPMDPDTDLDGYRPKDGLLVGSTGHLTDHFETVVLGTNGFAFDTDLDGSSDPLDINPLTDDSDGDGIKDLVEVASNYPADTGGPHPGQTATSLTDADSDEDGVLDGNEDVNQNGLLDPGEANPVVWDTDGDGLSDGQEIGLAAPQAAAHTDTEWFVADADPNTRTSPVDLDSDEDGIPDATEDNTDPINGRRDGSETDAALFDSDRDGLSDGLEIGLTAPVNPAATNMAKFQADADPAKKTDPLVADTEHDGLIDGLEDRNANGRVDAGETDPLNPDSDGDGLTDGEEVNIYKSNPLALHSDQDGLSDSDEVKVFRTSPASNDTDGDGLWDGADVVVGGITHRGERTYHTDARVADTDRDGLLDGFEVTGWSITVNGTAKTVSSDPTRPDTDADGLADGREYAKRSDPQSADTDGDGLTDVAEVEQHRSNPTEVDQDGDGLSDALEVRLGTSTILTDSDGDGLADGEEDGNHNGVVDLCETDPAKRDSDGDGIIDSNEILYSSQMRSAYFFSWEAEQASHLGWPVDGIRRYAFTPRQQGNRIDDTSHSASGAGATSVKTSPNGVYVAGIGNVVPNGTYQFYLRLRIQPAAGSSLTSATAGISVYWDTSSESSPARITTDYQWYSTRPRTVTGGELTLAVYRYEAGATYDIYLDKLILVRLDGAPESLRGGQVTLPAAGSADTDNDGIPDAEEIRTGVYWIEAENLDLGNASVYLWEDGAANGRSVRAKNSALPVTTHNSASSAFALNTGTYRLWVRARAFASPATQQLTVKVGATTKQFAFTNTQYYHWFNFGQATATPFSISITATSSVLVDRLLLASTNYGDLDLPGLWGLVTDPLTRDTDGGGARDADERITAGDGKDNPLDPTDDDLDGDRDGLSDAFEILNFGTGDVDGDGLPPALDPDSDGDGLNDDYETNQFGLADSDADGRLPALDRDSDGDGLEDGYEVTNFGLTDLDGDRLVAPLDADSDGDQLPDGYEMSHFGSANPDGDILRDGRPAIPALDPDSDNDGIGDYEEVNPGLDSYVSDPLKVDTDGDGLSDGDEVNRHHTNPSSADTDGDGLRDNLEIAGWDLLIYVIRTG